jgi:hypothetical protein
VRAAFKWIFVSLLAITLVIVAGMVVLISRGGEEAAGALTVGTFLLVFLLLPLASGLLTAYVSVAARAPAHPLLWGVVGFLFPIVGVFFVLVAAAVRTRAAALAATDDDPPSGEEGAAEDAPDPASLVEPPPLPLVPCAWCAGLIPLDVRRCPYCAGPCR